MTKCRVELLRIYPLLAKRQVKIAGYWPLFSHLDRTSLLNKGFIIWLYCQVKTAKNPKQNMKLFCSDGNSLQPVGVRFTFSASSLRLVYNHRKLGILNYHKDLVLQWLKESKQFSIGYVKCRFSQVREDFHGIRQTCHFKLNARWHK